MLSVEGRPLVEQVGSLAPVAYAYDSHGRVTRVGQASRSWRYAYDASGRLESVTDTLGRKTEFDYDAADRVIGQTLPDSSVIAFEYDANGNLSGLTPPGKPEHTFDYNGVDQVAVYAPPAVVAYPESWYDYNDDHQLIQVNRPDGLAVTLSYLSNGRLDELGIQRGQGRVHLPRRQRERGGIGRDHQLARLADAPLRLRRPADAVGEFERRAGRHGERHLRPRPAARHALGEPSNRRMRTRMSGGVGGE
ncbi:MAG: hypothetical protein ABIS67_14250 [Candidatus Eisenbacteria bacterium]